MQRSGVKFGLMLMALFLIDGFLMAQGAVPAGASVTSRAPLGWEAVQRLKPGTKVTVRQPLAPGEFEPRRSCSVVHVDATALTCVPDGERDERVTYPVGQIESVYRLKLHIPWIRGVLYAGAGAFVGGAVLTGGNWNNRSGTVGAIAGGIEAVIKDPPKTQLVLVYQRMPEPLTPSMESAFDELEGRPLSK